MTITHKAFAVRSSYAVVLATLLLPGAASAAPTAGSTGTVHVSEIRADVVGNVEIRFAEVSGGCGNGAFAIGEPLPATVQRTLLSIVSAAMLSGKPVVGYKNTAACVGQAEALSWVALIHQ